MPITERSGDIEVLSFVSRETIDGDLSLEEKQFIARYLMREVLPVVKKVNSIEVIRAKHAGTSLGGLEVELHATFKMKPSFEVGRP